MKDRWLLHCIIDMLKQLYFILKETLNMNRHMQAAEATPKA